jgi:hypothetical protein
MRISMKIEDILYGIVTDFDILTKMDCGSRDSVVGTATGYGLYARGFGVTVPVGSRIFSSPHRPDRLLDPPGVRSSGG